MKSRIIPVVSYLLRQYHKLYTYRVYPLKHNQYIRSLHNKRPISVAFIVMNIAMWKLQGLYELLKKDRNFEVYIILSPCVLYSKEQMYADLSIMRDYFDRLDSKYIDWKLESGLPPEDIKKTIKPDILFYTQPYGNSITPIHSYDNFRDRLLCYTPYAFITDPAPLLYDQFFHNIAWKLFYPTKYNLWDAKKMAANNGRNVVVSGYPNADLYLYKEKVDVWKKDGNKKRVIWAPHFTLIDDGSLFYHSNFLWMAEIMKQISIEYRDSIQFAFKPHPRLLTELYKHPQWGKERTNHYYDFWETNENTQLFQGDFVDLFYYSDGMIHDSGSFSVDYMYFCKPAMYISHDISKTKSYKNEFGKMVYDLQYVGKCENDIRSFIDEVIIKGNDYIKENRELFFNTYLCHENGRKVAQIMYDDIVKSLDINE